MKHLLLIAIIPFFFLIGCSDEVRIEVLSAKASIENDSTKIVPFRVSDGEDTRIVKPTALYYEFTFMNTGNQIIKGSDRLEYKIVPLSELKAELFDTLKMTQFIQASAFNYGFQPLPFKKNDKGSAYVYYHLGKYESDSKIPVFPSMSDLQGIKENAMNAELVLYLNGEELSRVALEDLEE